MALNRVYEMMGVQLESIEQHFDQRGSITILHKSNNVSEYFSSINEVFYTTSHKNVFRGLHFQNEPHSSAKRIMVAEGNVTEYIVDLRTDSRTFKSFMSFKLSAASPSILTIPRGLAHGYLCHETPTTVIYLMDNQFCSKCDSGISVRSIEEYLPIGLENLLISDRDSVLPELK